VLIGLVAAAAQSGDLDHAEAVARTFTNPSDDQSLDDSDAWAEGLMTLAGDAVRAGKMDRARWLAAEAEVASRSVPFTKGRALITLAAAAERVGDLGRARRLAAEAEPAVRAITSPGHRAHALIAMVTAAAQAGDMDRARRLIAEPRPSPARSAAPSPRTMSSACW
jgi:hypothetical protein